MEIIEKGQLLIPVQELRVLEKKIKALESKLWELESAKDSLQRDFRSAVERMHFVRTGKRNRVVAVSVDDSYSDCTDYLFLFKDGEEEPWCSGSISPEKFGLPILHIHRREEASQKKREFLESLKSLG